MSAYSSWINQSTSRLCCFFLLLFAATDSLAQDVRPRLRFIKTFAGTGTAGFNGNYRAATSTFISLPTSIWQDTLGNLYVTQPNQQRVRKVTYDGRNVSTIAGTGIVSTAGDGGLANQAHLYTPIFICGNENNDMLYIADQNNHRIRGVNLTTGVIDKVVGTGGVGVGGFTTDQVTIANNSLLNLPTSIVYYAKNQSFLVIEANNNRIRELFLAPNDSLPTTTTSANTNQNNMIIKMRTFLKNKQFTPSSLSLSTPSSMWLDANDNIYLTVSGTNRVLFISSTNTSEIRAIAGNGVYGFNGDNKLAITLQMRGPTGIWGLVDNSLLTNNKNVLYVCDMGSYRIRKLTPFNQTDFIMKTIAGNSLEYVVGVGGPALQAGIGSPRALTGHPVTGDLYFTSSSMVLKVTKATGVLELIAGSSVSGYNGDNIVANNALLSNQMYGLFVDPSGQAPKWLYISDTGNHRIRCVNFTTGIINTVLGLSGKIGMSPPGTSQAEALLYGPAALYVDQSKGEIIFTEIYNHRVRKLSNGIIFNIAGTREYGMSGASKDNVLAIESSINTPISLALDVNQRQLYFIERGNQRIRRYDLASKRLFTIIGNGTVGLMLSDVPALQALINPSGLFFHASSNNLFFTDSLTNRIFRYNVVIGGNIVTFAGKGYLGYDGDGSAAIEALFNNPYSLYIHQNLMYIGDVANNRIRLINMTTGIVSTWNPFTVSGMSGVFRGDYGPATSAYIGRSSGFALDPNSGAGGNPLMLYIADNTFGRIRKVSANVTNPLKNNSIVTIAGGTSNYLIAGPASSTSVGGIVCIWLSPITRDLYYTESSGSRIRRINANTSIASVIAGTGSYSYGGDNALGTSASFRAPWGICGYDVYNASFPRGYAPYLYVADSENYRIRRLSPIIINGAVASYVTTYTGRGLSYSDVDEIPLSSALFGVIRGIHCDPSSVLTPTAPTLYLSDSTFHVIRRIDGLKQTMTIVVGISGTNGFNGNNLLATKTRLSTPSGVWVDSVGNIYVADTNNHRIRKVSAYTNITTTIVGTGSTGIVDLPLKGTSATMNMPSFVFGDNFDNLYIADDINYRVRKLNLFTNIITTVAGNSKVGVRDTFRENVPVTEAAMSQIYQTLADRFSNRLFIVDRMFNRIRVVFDADYPTSQPSMQPTSLPSAQPRSCPTSQPSRQPMSIPSSQPSQQPTSMPSSQPSCIPSHQPMSYPSTQPSVQPSTKPTSHPSTSAPSSQPSLQPSLPPIVVPSCQPSRQPSSNPSMQPSIQPSSNPSMQPSTQPVTKPTMQPSTQPTSQPSSQPSRKPSTEPSHQPSKQPLSFPTSQPSFQPINKPTSQPSRQPSLQPSTQPTSQPSKQPATIPTSQPSRQPSKQPFSRPSAQPMSSPTAQPSSFPTSDPTKKPTPRPTIVPSAAPSFVPTPIPTLVPSIIPSQFPTLLPTEAPSEILTMTPSMFPTFQPTAAPSMIPTVTPSMFPSFTPSAIPSIRPTAKPSFGPSRIPTAIPTPIQGTLLFVRAQLLNSADVQLTLNFDVIEIPTTSDFACNSLLSFVEVATTRCQWVTAKSLLIRQPSNAVTVGSTVQFSSSAKLTYQCTATTTCIGPISRQTVSIGLPDSPQSPKITIVAPSVISMCDQLVLDLTGSSGNIGRPWREGEIHITTPQPSNQVFVSTLQTYVQNQFSTSVPITIAASLLTVKEIDMIFTVRLCNVFQICDQSNFNVSILNSTMVPPSVSIAGDQQRSITKSDVLLLSGFAFVSQCASKAARATGLRYSWDIRSIFSSGKPSLTSLHNTTGSTRYNVPLEKVSVNSNYVITLQVFDTVSKLSSSTTISVAVIPAPLVVSLVPSSMQSLRVGSTLLLDASNSYDPDDATKTLSNSWRCVDSITGRCPLTLTARQDLTLMVAAPAASINSTVTILLQVQLGSKSATTSIRVRIVGLATPLVNIISEKESLTNINVAKKVVIEATVQSEGFCQARWTSDSFAPTSAFTSGLLGPSIFDVVGSVTSTSLILAANSLQAGRSYSFQLTCGGGGAVRIDVTTNSPPSGGSFIVSPVAGVELETLFTLTTSQWFDNNLPIIYEFGVVLNAESSLTIRRPAEASSTVSALPAGNSLSNFAVNTSVIAFDNLQASSYRFRVVKVDALSLSQRQASLLTNLQSLNMSSMDLDSVQNIIALSTASINVVDCSNAPSCNALNRDACSDVANTCGRCLEGFIGETSSANTICYSPSAFTGLTSRKLTSFPQKECSNACSQRGNCVYINQFGDPSLADFLESCSIVDESCSAKCVCVAGYTGPDCSMTELQYENSLSLRNKLLTGLSMAANRVEEETSQKSLLTSISNVQAIVRGEADLTTSSALQLRDVLNTLLRQANSEDLSYSEYSALVSPLEALLTRFLTNGASSTSQGVNGISESISLMQTFIKQVANTQIQQEKAFTYASSDVKFYTMKQKAKDVVKLPQTPFANALKEDAISLELATASNVQSNVNIQAIQLPPSVWLGTHNTSNTSLAGEIRSPVFSITLKSNLASDIIMRIPMQHNVTINSTQTLEFVCRLGKDRSLLKAKCADSQIELVHQCNGTAGRFLKSCPVLLPVCSKLHLDTQTVGSSVCNVVNRTDTYLTCKCKLQYSSKRRQLGEDTLQQSGVLTMAALTVYTFEGVKDTFLATPDFNSASALEQTQTVITMFAVLWASGAILLLVSYYQQYRSKTAAENKQQLKDKAGLDVGQFASVVPLGMSKTSNSIHLKAEGRAALMQRLLTYLNIVLPPVFANKSFLLRTRDELLKHHSYLQLFFGGPIFSTSPTRGKLHSDGKAVNSLPVIKMVQVLTIQTMLMFLLAALYDLQSPEDSTANKDCILLLTQETCLQQKALFDNTQSFCQWDATYQQCFYERTEFTFQMAVFCTVLSSLCTAIFLRPLNYMFRILQAPSEEHIRANVAASSAFRQIQMQIGKQARRASAAIISVLPITVQQSTKIAKTDDQHFATRFIPQDTYQAYRDMKSYMHVVLPQMHERLSNRFSRTGSVSSSNTNILSKKHTSFLQASGQRVGTGDVNNVMELILQQRKQIHDSIVYYRKDILGIHVEEEEKASTNTLTLVELSLLDTLSKACEQFDNDWTIAAKEEAFKSPLSMQVVLQKELEYVQKATEQGARELLHATETHRGLEILQYFLHDLLGRDSVAGRIFTAKYEEDYSHLPVVKRRVKVFVASIIIGMNLFFIYFTVIRALQRGQAWQSSYLVACLIQLLLEACLYETLECLWIHVIVPNFVSKEVTRVYKIVDEVVELLCAGISSDNKSNEEALDGSKMLFNSPDHFFISTQLAKKYPDLVESLIVLSYWNYLPGDDLKEKLELTGNKQSQEGSKSGITMKLFSMLGFLLWSVSSFLVYTIAMIPFELQRMLIRFLQPFFYGGLLLLWWQISSSFLYRAIFVVAIVFAAVVLMLMYFQEKRRKAAITNASLIGGGNKILPIVASIDHTVNEMMPEEASVPASIASNISWGMKGSTAGGSSFKVVPMKAMDSIQSTESMKMTSTNESKEREESLPIGTSKAATRLSVAKVVATASAAQQTSKGPSIKIQEVVAPPASVKQSSTSKKEKVRKDDKEKNTPVTTATAAPQVTSSSKKKSSNDKEVVAVKPEEKKKASTKATPSKVPSSSSSDSDNNANQKSSKDTKNASKTSGKEVLNKAKAKEEDISSSSVDTDSSEDRADRQKHKAGSAPVNTGSGKKTNSSKSSSKHYTEDNDSDGDYDRNPSNRSRFSSYDSVDY